MNDLLQAPLERHGRLGELLGIDLYVQRDDLIPFPLAGNKVRKIRAELENLGFLPDMLISNGGVDSNHCRTVALLAAQRGIRAHLVLHGASATRDDSALMLMKQLGATTSLAQPDDMGAALAEAETLAKAAGLRAHVIPGGCHSPAGAAAYKKIGLQIFTSLRPDFVFLASGTGATQGGLVAAGVLGGWSPRIVGISVARSAKRGIAPVQHAAGWAGADHAEVVFDDRFRAGGYGLKDSATRKAVALGWSQGLPLDGTYTGKAFAGLLDYAEAGSVSNARVLFWHTGGLWNHLQELHDDLAVCRDSR